MARALACPDCEKRMVETRLKGVRVDQCEYCLGIYFDAGELAEALACPIPPFFPGELSKRSCPACDQPFRIGLMGYLAVDVCDECIGIFLDGGEFKALRKGRTPVRTKPREMLDNDGDLRTSGAWGLVLLAALANASLD